MPTFPKPTFSQQVFLVHFAFLLLGGRLRFRFHIQNPRQQHIAITATAPSPTAGSEARATITGLRGSESHAEASERPGAIGDSGTGATAPAAPSP